MAQATLTAPDHTQRRIFFRSLLHVRVALSVILARKRVPAAQVLKLVPGAMIQFDLHCDTPLRLELDGKAIAVGDVIKVGDKFGLKIQLITARRERWVDVAEPLMDSPSGRAEK